MIKCGLHRATHRLNTILCDLQSRAANNRVNMVPFSGCWWCSANGRSPNALCFLPQRKYPKLRQQSQKLRFVGLFHSWFLSRSIKLRSLPPSAFTVSLHYLPKTGLPGPGGPKMPKCTSKYARQLQKCQTSWYGPMAVNFELPGLVMTKIQCCYETKHGTIANINKWTKIVNFQKCHFLL